MPNQRKRYTSEEKAIILKENLVENVPVSDLCDRYSIHPTQFYRWQKQMFENIPALFESKRNNHVIRLERENGKLKERLLQKDTVIAEIMEDYIRVKKNPGDR